MRGIRKCLEILTILTANCFQKKCPETARSPIIVLSFVMLYEYDLFLNLLPFLRVRVFYIGIIVRFSLFISI